MTTRSFIIRIARQQNNCRSQMERTLACKASLSSSISIRSRQFSLSHRYEQKLEAGRSSETNSGVEAVLTQSSSADKTENALEKDKEISKTTRKTRLKVENRNRKLNDRATRRKDQKQKQAQRERQMKRLDEALSAEQVKKWEKNMENMLGHNNIEDKPPEESVTVEIVSNKSNRGPTLAETTDRESRAARLAQTVDAARGKQPISKPDGSGRRIISTSTLIPGSGTGVIPTKLSFEETEIVYPPKEVYPPPSPLVHENNLLEAARALGIIRTCEIEWDKSTSMWRRTNRTIEYYEERNMLDNLDNERGLEYLGDACLHLLSRSLLMSQYPGKTVSAYNAASSWLVSNDCFAYMFEDSGLEEVRIHVAKMMMEESKKRELQETFHLLTEEERKIREESPVPEPSIGINGHLRKADLLEAYVGAVYLIYGFPMAARWCTPLLAPWLDLIGRTTEFQQDRFLSPAGEAVKRRAEREKKEAEKAEKAEKEAREHSKPWWQKATSNLYSRLFRPSTEPKTPPTQTEKKQ